MTGSQRPAACGLLVVDKPTGWSSMDVIRRLRGALRAGGFVGSRRQLKVGHAGTLDPLATGVLVCCVGKATRQVERLMGLAKVYEADVDLSAFTTTDDREGAREPISVSQPPRIEQVRSVLMRFVGQIEQTPPAFSAVHVDGRRAYELARRGETVQMKPRHVRIDAIDLLGYDWPTLRLRVTCGRGTYIRSLARDIGKALNTGGHLASLRRTAVGPYDLSMAVPGERLATPITQADLMPV